MRPVVCFGSRSGDGIHTSWKFQTSSAGIRRECYAPDCTFNFCDLLCGTPAGNPELRQPAEFANVTAGRSAPGFPTDFVRRCVSSPLPIHARVMVRVPSDLRTARECALFSNRWREALRQIQGELVKAGRTSQKYCPHERSSRRHTLALCAP